MKKQLLFILFPILTFSQIQIGQDIDGEAADDKLGFSVALSSDGAILAIGAKDNSGTDTWAGHVRVYKNESGTWTQIGNDIDGEARIDQFGWDLSLSSDGNIVAIGAINNDGINGADSGHVRVYKNESGTWIQIGSDIDGEAAGDKSGFSVSLSSNGNIIAIGAYNNGGNGVDSGHVRVYKNESGVWTQLGNDIDGEMAGDRSGYSVSLSSDGNILAIGADFNDGNGDNSGHVRVYKNESGVWTQLGNDIDGEMAGDRLGFSIGLSSNGTLLAVGAGNNGNGVNSGYVQVYKNESSVWTQVGTNIYGEAANDRAGIVSLSADGSILAVGADLNDGNGNNSGHVRVYQNVSGIWTQQGNDIDGEMAGDRLGYSISLSSDGSILAIGAPFNDGINGIDSGHVRVYDLSAVLSIQSFKKDYFSFYPNPVIDVLNVNINTGLELKQVNIYNTLSQYLYSVKTSKIDVSGLARGIYFVEVETNRGKSAKKIVVE